MLPRIMVKRLARYYVMEVVDKALNADFNFLEFLFKQAEHEIGAESIWKSLFSDFAFF